MSFQIKKKEDGTGLLKILSTISEDKGNYVAKAINIHGEAKAFARLVVKTLGDFKRNEEFIQMEEKLIQPAFKEVFEDRKIPEGISTKFECIVIGKPSPKVYKSRIKYFFFKIVFFIERIENTSHTTKISLYI